MPLTNLLPEASGSVDLMNGPAAGVPCHLNLLAISPMLLHLHQFFLFPCGFDRFVCLSVHCFEGERTTFLFGAQ